MIIVIANTCKKLDRYGSPTGETEVLISHGVDMDTGNFVVLPNIPPWMLGAVFDSDIGEYVLEQMYQCRTYSNYSKAGKQTISGFRRNESGTKACGNVRARLLLVASKGR